MIKLAIALTFLSVGISYAHDAPSGWPYPAACCSSADCYQIKESELKSTKEGWKVLETDETLEYSSKRVRPSGDGQYHRCSLLGDKTAHTFCLFIPGGV